MQLENILLNENVISYTYQHLKELLKIIPELKLTINFNQHHPHHHLTVFNHTLLAISFAPKDYTLRLTLLLHDIGKVYSFVEKDGVRYYPNHAEISSQIARNILVRLGYDLEYINIVCELIKWHDTKINEQDIKENYDFYYMLYQIQYCDALSHHPLKLENRVSYLNELKKIIEEYKHTR